MIHSASQHVRQACLFRNLSCEDAIRLLERLNRNGKIIEHDGGWLELDIDCNQTNKGDLVRRRTSQAVLHVLEVNRLTWYLVVYESGQCVTALGQSAFPTVHLDDSNWNPEILRHTLNLSADEISSLTQALKRTCTLHELLGLLGLSPCFCGDEKLSSRPPGQYKVTSVEVPARSPQSFDSALVIPHGDGDDFRFPLGLFGQNYDAGRFAAALISHLWKATQLFDHSRDFPQASVLAESHEIMLEMCELDLSTTLPAWRLYHIAPQLSTRIRNSRNSKTARKARIVKSFEIGTSQLWFSLALLFHGDLMLRLNSLFTDEDFAWLLDRLLHWVPEIRHLSSRLRFVEYFTPQSHTPAWARAFIEIANFAGADIDPEETEIEYRGDWLAHLNDRGFVMIDKGRPRVAQHR